MNTTYVCNLNTKNHLQINYVNLLNQVIVNIRIANRLADNK